MYPETVDVGSDTGVRVCATRFPGAKHLHHPLAKITEAAQVEADNLAQEIRVEIEALAVEQTFQPVVEVLLKEIEFVPVPWQPRWIDEVVVLDRLKEVRRELVHEAACKLQQFIAIVGAASSPE